MIENTMKKLNKNTNLNYEETKKAFTEILDGKATIEQVNDFITILGQKIENPDEIAGTVDALNTHILNSHSTKTVLNKLGLRKDYSNSLNF